MIKFLFLFLSATSCLSADIPDHFKKTSDKTGDHSMRNIDFIYTLNLDERPEKFALCTEQLNPYGIYPYRFSAVNGWKLTLEDINDIGVKYKSWMEEGHMASYYPLDGDGKPVHELMQVKNRTYFCHCMARGTIGIVLSHLSILQDALDSGYETIWVMEDDIQVIRDPNLISDMIDELDHLVGYGNWDILFTDKDTKDKRGNYIPCLSYAWRPNYTPKNPGRFAQRKDVSPDFTKIGARYGAYSMIVRRSGMKKIMKFILENRVFLPYDMDFYLPSKINLYCVRDDIVSTLCDALTDNGSPNYDKKCINTQE
jgi:GR25 family glycosyltransferase involved in LPS biosynthesis